LSLKHSYTLIAPVYDALLGRATKTARQRSLSALPGMPGRILLAGVGTGLDLPQLPSQHHYVGIDFNQAMLQRSLPQARHCDFQAIRGDVQRLPFAEASFDGAVLHLILAVVPEPAHCLAEISRVLRPGGQILVFDKFLRRGQAAPLRRLINPLMRRVATRLDVVFEDLLAARPELRLDSDQPALAGGWFRLLRLSRV
jgi:ubiquinone/menaquinone biosynthesis C-methylase UbiE